MQAVITGGSGSLGQALVSEFQRQAWDVLAPSRSEMDATDAAQVARWFQTLSRAPDCMVHAVGVVADGPFIKLSELEWDRVVEANLKSAFLCSQAAAERMAAEGRPGQVVLVGSFAALMGTAGQSAYAAAKAGLLGLGKSLAREWGPHEIRVNMVLPGWLVPSRMTAAASAEANAHSLKQHVLGKWNTPESAARFIVFMQEMTAVSGQVFQLDSRVGRF